MRAKLCATSSLGLFFALVVFMLGFVACNVVIALLSVGVFATGLRSKAKGPQKGCFTHLGSKRPLGESYKIPCKQRIKSL